MTQDSPVLCITQTQLTFIVPTTHEQTLTCYIENTIIISYEKDVFAVSNIGSSEEKYEYKTGTTGVEPMTYWLLLCTITQE